MKNNGAQFYARAIICTSLFLILFFISFSEADININDRRLRRDQDSQPFHNTKNQFGKYHMSQDPLVKINRFRKSSSGLGFPLRIQIRSLKDEAQLGEMAMNATEKPEKEKQKSK